ncbi:MAG: homoserine dehydrogenase [Alphaproteobacteria bacterium]|nr:homoserine dehydrogenase [Alphaproteobacteria bacterium]
MSAPLRIGLAGLGTVGAGVVRLLKDRGPALAERCGRRIEIAAVSARDPSRDRGIDLSGIDFVETAVGLAAREDVDVVVELIGGAGGAARALVEAALGAGKSVVTGNKALIAEAGGTLAPLAEAHRVHLRYEAAVGGGIPVIKALSEGLAANRIRTVRGILNGTSNYILTRMEEGGTSFASALADAQAKGYAEADPTFDIDGTDAAHKLAILASLAFGVVPAPHAVHKEGLAGLTDLDISAARAFGYSMKLLAVAEETPDGLLQRVHPALVPADSPLAAVRETENAITIEGDYVGRSVIQGLGAGAGPTASAVVADLLDIARGVPPAPVFGRFFPRLAEARPARLAARQGGYFLRLKVQDRPRVMAAVADTLGDAEVSIDQMHQPHHVPNTPVSIVLTTYDTDEAVMAAAVERLARHPALIEAPRLIRIEA